MASRRCGFNVNGLRTFMFDLNPLRQAASALLVLTAVAGLGACVPVYSDRGDLPSKDKLAQLRPGATTKEQVIKILGSPSSIGVFNDNSWYYVSRKTKQVAFFEPEVLDQQVYVVTFDAKGVVQGVGHRTMADGREIEPAPGATPAPGRQLTFLEQIIGNVGRFNKGAASTSDNGSGERQRPNGPVPNSYPGEPVPQQ
jgi:outer membrane protein assembly factor BamE (lipoprotein component of BamABCDE complex)